MRKVLMLLFVMMMFLILAVPAFAYRARPVSALPVIGPSNGGRPATRGVFTVVFLLRG